MRLNVTSHEIELFKKDIWKDVRRLETVKENDILFIKRYSDGITPIHNEIAFYNFLKSREIGFKTPLIYEKAADYIKFEYLGGIRLFNFIVELRYLYLIEKSSKALKLAELIQDILLQQLLDFQEKTTPWVNSVQSYYPYLEKCSLSIEILTNILSIEYDQSEVLSDLSILRDVYVENSDSLFRDASSKNAILNLPNLFYGNFKDDADRRILIRHLIESNYFTEDLIKSSLYQLDFSGCVFKAPKIDDAIAIFLHESMWWTSSAKRFFKNNGKDFLFISALFLRLFRFGTRKLIYRLLHKEGHKIRFRYDFEKLYFSIISGYIKKLQKSEILRGKEILRLLQHFEKATSLNPQEDYLEKLVDLNKYYQDIFYSKP